MTLLPDIDRTGNCLTNTSVLLHWAGTGPICNGRGQCVNSRCQCDSGWTGRGDVFTLEGYSCIVPVLLEQIMWYSVAAAFFIGFFRGLRILHRESNKHGPQHAWRMTYTCVSVFLFTVPFIALAFTRAYLHQNIGVDVAPTLLATFAYSFQQLATGADSYVFARIVVSSNLDNVPIKHMLLDRIYYQVMFTTFATMFVNNACWLTGLFVPAGPTLTRLVLTFLRFAASLAWMFEIYFISSLLLTEMHKIKAALGSTSNPNNSNLNKAMTSSPIHAKLKYMIQQLERKISSTKKAIIFFVCINSVFLLCPPLFVFQFVLATVLYIFSAFSMVTQYDALKKQGGADHISDEHHGHHGHPHGGGGGDQSPRMRIGGRDLDVLQVMHLKSSSPLSPATAASSIVMHSLPSHSQMRASASLQQHHSGSGFGPSPSSPQSATRPALSPAPVPAAAKSVQVSAAVVAPAAAETASSEEKDADE